MSRDIQLKFEATDELILLVDAVKKKLKTNGSALARIALYEFCKRIVEENGKGKPSPGN